MELHSDQDAETQQLNISADSTYSGICSAHHIKRYVIWKIRQAQQGDGVERDYRVLSIRMESDLVEKLDEAWKRQGLKSRMELFRRSLSTYLAGVGENELAEMLVL